jgi:hypothetical protein
MWLYGRFACRRRAEPERLPKIQGDSSYPTVGVVNVAAAVMALADSRAASGQATSQ